MGSESNIGWTNDTWNPWQGYHKVSSGCVNCYMYRDKKRYGNSPEIVVRSKPATFNSPLNKLKGPFVFTCSWSDFFIEEADNWRREAWDIIKITPHLTYQILTKRPENIKSRLPDDWGDGYDNVWLGVSVENYSTMHRVTTLSKIKANRKFISAEPLLGPVYFVEGINEIDWIITGGESGPDYRAADHDWFRIVRDQCENLGIPYFHKQHGGTKKIDGIFGGRLLDDKIWNEIPTSDFERGKVICQSCGIQYNIGNHEFCLPF